eukprot:TRINITY_DN11439_c1_g2_i1.p1 TRINITY_DN11439_c1_g2~~TRINITY_DN11439_c1_g2_i1.p1  ORF type:complete len:106 (+),score=5.50 TRINITY_DN11439_c1_g2_i1:38-319(+)
MFKYVCQNEPHSLTHTLSPSLSSLLHLPFFFSFYSWNKPPTGNYDQSSARRHVPHCRRCKCRKKKKKKRKEIRGDSLVSLNALFFFLFLLPPV